MPTIFSFSVSQGGCALLNDADYMFWPFLVTILKNVTTTKIFTSGVHLNLTKQSNISVTICFLKVQSPE